MTDLGTVTNDSYLEDLQTRGLGDLRAMRSDCQDLENAVSYVRRVLHGRIDIVAAEAARRRDGADTDHQGDHRSNARGPRRSAQR